MNDPTGMRCDTVQNSVDEEAGSDTVECDPEQEDLPEFEFDRPIYWDDFGPDDLLFHQYDFWDYAPAGLPLEDLVAAFLERPTPSNKPGDVATQDGNRIVLENLAPLDFDHGDPVRSYVRTDADGNIFIVNVTEGPHSLHSGFVVRMVVPGAGGAPHAIRTYGEGNALLQKMPFAKGMAKSAWSNVAKQTFSRAQEISRGRSR